MASRTLEEEFVRLCLRQFEGEEKDWPNEIVIEDHAHDPDPPGEREAMASLVKWTLDWTELSKPSDDHETLDARLAAAAGKFIDRKRVNALLREALQRFVPRAVKAARKTWLETGWIPNKKGQ